MSNLPDGTDKWIEAVSAAIEAEVRAQANDQSNVDAPYVRNSTTLVIDGAIDTRKIARAAIAAYEAARS